MFVGTRLSHHDPVVVCCSFFCARKSWTNSIKKDFTSFVSIKHLTSSKYLAVSHDNSLILSTKFNETCIFGLWKRQGEIFGLQSKYSRKWAGQTLLGNLACSANAFGRREEWDVRSLCLTPLSLVLYLYTLLTNGLV